MPKKRICVILERADELPDMIRKESKGRFRDRLRLSGLPETGKHGTCRGTIWYYLSYGGRIAPPLRKRRNRGTSLPRNRARTAAGNFRRGAGRSGKTSFGPEGFRSRNEIRTWLTDEYDLGIPYETVRKTVRCCLGAKPKSPRPSHIGKNEDEVRGFIESFPE